MEWSDIKGIVLDIIDITRDKLVKWNSDAEDGITVFFVLLGLGKVLISRQYESLDDTYDYILEIRNSDGDVIFSFATEYGDRMYQNILQDLYEEAENSSLQRQVTIKSIKDEISRIKSEHF